MAPHLLFAITPHGFGHAAMTAPVVNMLGKRHPDWRTTLRTTISPEFVAKRFKYPYSLQQDADDFGMVQKNALEIDVEASAEKYLRMHSHWDAAVERMASTLAAARIDLVVANIPYLTLAAAQMAGIRNIAFSCLHWGDIYAHYCLNRPEGEAIYRQIITSYGSADCFVRPEPAMPMSDLGNLHTVGPVATRGIVRRAELDEQLALHHGECLVLISMGGIAFRLPMEDWPPIPGVRYLVQQNWQVERDDCVVLESLSMPFPDLLASCDLLVTKPGYGSFSEAAVNGIPVLYVSRADWPESPWLIRWLEQHGICAEIDYEQLKRGELAAAITTLLSRGRPVAVNPNGIAQTVDIIEALL